MSGHTPGPWYAIPKGSNREEVCAMYRIDNKQNAPWGNFGQIAYAHKQDAFLIAAAPDLLEALQSLVKSLSDQDDEGLIEHAHEMIAARSAIAKAQGPDDE